MSWTLARLTASITSLSAILLAFALLLGSAVPPPAHASLLTSNTCTLPCIFDVTPGVTLRNDAMVALERLGLSYSFLSQNQSASFTVRESHSARSTLALLNFGGRGDMNVQAVHLYQMGPGRELGILSDFLLLGYHPTHVLSECQNTERVYLIFEQALLLQLEIGAYLEPDDPVTMVASAGEGNTVTPVGGFACNKESPWLGFAPLWKYLAVP